VEQQLVALDRSPRRLANGASFAKTQALVKDISSGNCRSAISKLILLLSHANYLYCQEDRYGSVDRLRDAADSSLDDNSACRYEIDVGLVVKVQ